MPTTHFEDDFCVQLPPAPGGLAHFPVLESAQAHPSEWIFPAYLRNSSCRWLASLEDLYAQPITFPASLSPEAGLLLHGLIRNLRPRVIIEVGVFCSISTHWMASALLENGCVPGRDAIIHCFDDFRPIRKGPWRDVEMLEGRENFVKERLDRAGLLEFVTIHKGDSSEQILAMQQQLTCAGGVDFAFLDGDHTIPGVVADFVATEPVLNTGGHVLFHDTFPGECTHIGPRYVLDHVRTFASVGQSNTIRRTRNTRRSLKAARKARRDGGTPRNARQAIGEGVYDRMDLYLQPTNYGFGLLRRLK